MTHPMYLVIVRENEFALSVAAALEERPLTDGRSGRVLVLAPLGPDLRALAGGGNLRPMALAAYVSAQGAGNGGSSAGTTMRALWRWLDGRRAGCAGRRTEHWKPPAACSRRSGRCGNGTSYDIVGQPHRIFKVGGCASWGGRSGS